MDKKLFEETLKTRDNAYVPYSKFKVGAGLLMDDGVIITGCNVENASYGLSNCGERTALFTAYAKGYRKENIKEMIVLGDTKGPLSPCGACRQVMVELLPKDAIITLANVKGDTKVMTLEELVPYSFEEIEL